MRMTLARPAPEEPDEVHARQRYIKIADVEWAKQCDQIMMRHGQVVGSETYPNYNRARYHVRKLKKIMDQLRIHPSWQLREHVERARGGWVWSLEYLGRNPDG